VPAHHKHNKKQEPDENFLFHNIPLLSPGLLKIKTLIPMISVSENYYNYIFTTIGDSERYFDL